jgi:HK97 family phage prohead protease
MWDDAQKAIAGEHHDAMVSLVATRQRKSEAFGYGITTAEPYVQEFLRTENAGYKSGRVIPTDQLIKEARRQLVYASPDMVMERVVKSIDGTGLEQTDLPSNTLLAIQHILTTDREDRDGDILRTAGAQLDPKSPLLWQHQHFLPVGKVVKTIEQTASNLRVLSVLLDINELTSDVAKFVEAGVLRFSHGFRVLDYDARKDEDGNETGGFEILKFEILEASLVSVPSNVDAEIELYSRGKLESDMFKAHAHQVMANRPVITIGCSFPEMTTTTWTGDVITVQAGEKGGRVLSQRNVDVLEEIVGDLEELSAMDLTRSGEALVERCLKKLRDVLKTAMPDDSEDKQMASGNDDQEAIMADMQLSDVVAFILGATKGDRQELKRTLESLSLVDQFDETASDYRCFVEAV